MRTKTVIFIGPQGSGKGTQIEKLNKVLGDLDPENKVVDIQTGRRFRAMAAKGEGYTERHVSRTLDTGALQPLFLSVSLWADAMREHLDDKCHVLIDGFPRVVEEAKVMESALSFYKRDNIDVINLDTPEEVVKERMLGRGRGDDTEDSVEERLSWYRSEVLPVIEYYREREGATVYDIDGTKDIDGVHNDIVAALSLQ
tara:strand:- start:1571 stop:2167 length:597 start_codon:yes stop_codon:yes gene_type:complete